MMNQDTLQSLFILPNIPIKQVMQTLSETGERILFVIDDQRKLLGTVTDGDIRRGILDGKPLNTQVQDVMQTAFISIPATSENIREQARKLMQHHRIEQIPVVNDDGTFMDLILWLDYLHQDERPAEQVVHSETPVVIMAGGKGTRLDPFTKILPKPLIPLNNTPIIEHIMNRFYQHGFGRFIIIVNYKKEMIKTYFSETRSPYQIEFIEEGDYCGTAGGLFLLKGTLNKTFLVTNCDTILDGNYLDFLTWHKEKNNIITIIGSHKEITVPYGVLNMNNGSFIGIEEKPKFDLFINTGTYLLEPEVLQCIHEHEYLDMDKLLDRMNGIYHERISVYPHWEGWFDIGQWDEYKRSVEKLEIR